MRFPLLRLPENLSFALYQLLFTNLHCLFSGSLFRTYTRQNKNTAVRSMKAMLAAAVLLCGGRYGVFAGESIWAPDRVVSVSLYVRYGSLRVRRLARVCWREVGCLDRALGRVFCFAAAPVAFSGSPKRCFLEGAAGAGLPGNISGQGVFLYIVD